MTTLRFQGVLLPDDEPRELWLLGDRVTFQRPSGDWSTASAGGYLVPGLVDVHTHPGCSPDGGFDAQDFAGHCLDHLRAGVTTLRFPGLSASAEISHAHHLPRMVGGGRWLAWSGLSSHAEFHVVVDDLATEAAADAARTGWCKVFCDWDFEADPVPLEILRQVVEAVHAVGGRVAAHAQSGAGAYNAAAAGVDSIEHGMGMPSTAVPLMVAHDCAYVPTLSAFASQVEHRKARNRRRDQTWLAGYQTMIERVRDAHDAGVTVLAGTDRQPFGAVADEVECLIQADLPPTAAIGAASWTARTWLGLPGFMEGDAADFVIYPEDPRTNPAVLRHPSHVVLRGKMIRQPG
ncbi:imidazolonepropionase-like amidohydrolase [Kibdelosporangium banguiense]|uniref:Imidazolonepropionase-like amidohydrolase n=1 Tax=Kibdelosporangium banguiense TaxID=1365924 RepID=A0ABS4TKL1_9PSEU|nr:amidohydrolase family protein [Kibdelosporangium banguiense]MBP2324964.1 imidazolonepropionase-like amidohydrolase [Kibdelosporangium banguiense]